MARSRNIKPALFDNDTLAENDPLGRLLFIGMWTIADYKGDFIWKPKRVKAKLLPYDDCDITKLAINLEQSGFIRYYSDGANVFCNVVNFRTHQNPHPNEKKSGSDIPEYTDLMAQAVDLKRLTINHDKSRLVSDKQPTDRADSLLLIPDSPIPITDTGNQDCSIPFEDFWINYPRKTDKAKAKVKWDRMKVNDELYQQIVTHCTTAFLGTDKNYIPHATTYLNGKRWEDEVITNENTERNTNEHNFNLDYSAAAAEDAFRSS